MKDCEQLPAGWANATLADLGVWSSGGTPNKKKPGYHGGDIPWLLTGDLDDGPINYVPNTITQAGLENSSAKLFPANTLLMAMYGATIGKLGVLKIEAATNQACAALLPSEANQCSLPYVYYFLLLKREDFKKAGKGGAQPNISQTVIKQTPIQVAPLKEQRRIVEKIETLFARLDKGEEAVREVQKLLTRYRQSVLKSAVTGQLTADWRAKNNAAEWQEIQLGDVTEFLTSGSRGWAKYYSDEGDIFVRAQNLKFDRLDLDDIAFVSLPAKSEGKRTRVRKGDLLITITGANVTKSALVEEDIGTAYVSQHVALLRPTENALPEFLYWFIIAAAAGRKQLEDFAYGAGKPGLNLTNIREVKLRLPSMAEQQVIADRLREDLSKQKALEEEVGRQLKLSASLRQSILKDAFAGQLVPQDPTDEPASDLLAHIKESSAPTSKPRRRAHVST